MIGALNSIADIVIPALVKINLQILPYVPLVFITAKMVSRRDPKLAYGIWWLLILKCFIPFKLFVFQREIPLKIQETTSIFSEPFSSSGFVSIENKVNMLSVHSFLLIGYLAILAILLVTFFYRKQSIKKLIIRNLDDHEIINHIKNHLVIKGNIKIYQIDAYFACTTGFLEHCIYLPKDILGKPKWEIESIVLHEFMHIENRDSLFFNILQILKTVFWFNPIFLFIVKEMLFLQELICDQRVLSKSVLDKNTYGMAIINFNHRRQSAFLSPNFPLSSKRIFKRIEQLNRRKEMKASLKLFTIFSVIILMLFGFNLTATSIEKNFVCPMKEGRISSPFGMRKDPFNGRIRHHNGIDISAPRGTPVYSAKSGVVIFAAFKKNFGNIIIVRHNDAETAYSQLSSILVKKGDRVKQDLIIGKVGSSGRSTGPHLHFEIRKNDKPVDPEKHIDFSLI